MKIWHCTQSFDPCCRTNNIAAAYFENCPFPPLPDTGHILVAYNHKMFPMISSISVQSLVLLS